jgi:hypothetical protein
MAGLDQLGAVCPVTRHTTVDWLGLWPRGGVSGRRHLREIGPSPVRKVGTDRVRGRGRLRRKKEMWHELMGDVSGIRLVPDPSLDGTPQAEGPTAHRLGTP